MRTDRTVTLPDPVVATKQDWDALIWETFRRCATTQNIYAHDLAREVFELVRSHFGHIPHDPEAEPVAMVTDEDLVHSLWRPLVDCASTYPDAQEKLAEFIPWLLDHLRKNGYEKAAAPQIVWIMWYMMDDARGGPCERDTPCEVGVAGHTSCFNQDPRPYDGTPAEQRAYWANYCRFSAILTKEKIVDLSKVLQQASLGVLFGESAPRYNPDAQLLAFEKIFAVCGDILWKRGGYWRPADDVEKGPALTKLWKEYEWNMRKIMNDEARTAEVRASAENILGMMKAVRLQKRVEEEERAAIR